MLKEIRMDSLDIVEVAMVLEESLDGYENLTEAERERLLRELRARIEGGEFGDDEGLAMLVRKLGPKGPLGEAGAAVRPDSTSFE